MKLFSEENVDLLLPLIGDYEVNTLKTTCEEVLLERELSVKLLLQAQQSQVIFSAFSVLIQFYTHRFLILIADNYVKNNCTQ